MSSAEYLVREFSRHKAGVSMAAAVLVLMMVTGGYFIRQASCGSFDRGLPFNNAGNNADMEYLSDGLSESLTNNLSPVSGLTVISRYSSFKYKGKRADPQEVGRVWE